MMNDGSVTALGGLRVVEMGQLLAGPFCAQLLGDFGAEVIKVEPPGSGDPMREWGREKPHGLSLWFPVVGRNKKSVTINLRVKEGQELAQELVSQADVLVENFRPGTLEKWGLGYDVLARINPRLVMTRVTGYGQTGPYSERAGYGAIGEAMGGIRYITGDPASLPARVGISLGDALAGVFAAVGTLVALRARDKTGRGQVVDAALYESVLALMESLIPEYALAGYTRERTGSILPMISPSNAYPTKGGDMILIAANQDTVYRRLCEVMGRPDLATDERYVSHTARGHHQQELDEIIAAWTRGWEAEELLASLHGAGVPAGRIYRAKDMLVDPHFAARQMIVHLTHPLLGDFPMHNVVPKLSETPGSVNSVGPELGAHNAEILGGLLGKDESALNNWRAAGVI